jgi:hypothetical protein
MTQMEEPVEVANRIAFAKAVLGEDLAPWQLSILSRPQLYSSFTLQRHRRGGWATLRAAWLDKLFPERVVGRTVAGWHGRGLLTPQRDTPMMYSVPRMLDLDR